MNTSSSLHQIKGIKREGGDKQTQRVQMWGEMDDAEHSCKAISKCAMVSGEP